MLWDQWNAVFKNTLGHADRSIVSELRDVRNRWAHNEQFSSNDAIRSLASMERLLNAVSAAEAGSEVGQMRRTFRVIMPTQWTNLGLMTAAEAKLLDGVVVDSYQWEPSSFVRGPQPGPPASHWREIISINMVEFTPTDNGQGFSGGGADVDEGTALSPGPQPIAP